MTLNNAFSAQTCIVGVVVANESNRVAAHLTPGLALDHVLLLFPSPLALLAAILDLRVTKTPILLFRAC